jgi:hypothetical protein
MDYIKQLVGSWLTSWKTLLIVGGVLLIWLVVGYVTSHVYQGCAIAGQDALRSFLDNMCAKEGERNIRIINTLFAYFIVPAACGVTFLLSLMTHRPH